MISHFYIYDLNNLPFHPVKLSSELTREYGIDKRVIF